jgi:hypothetical protein
MRSNLFNEPRDATILGVTRRDVRETAPGLVTALFLHCLIVALVILLRMPIGTPPQQSALRIVPVDVVQFGEETASPPAVLKSAIPQQKRASLPRQDEASPAAPEGTSPQGAKPVPLDNIDTKLRALARLRQPDSPPAVIDNSGESDITSASADAASGDQAAYSVRDFVRQQVVRHWSLDLHTLGSRRFLIAIHVVMTRTGKIEKAEIVDMQRYRVDPVFRDIALSARNAVLLSSPVPLPVGNYAEVMQMTLNFSPRDALQ